MLSQNELKYLKSLHQRKFRQKYGIFIAEGVKTAREVLQSEAFQIEGVFALQEWLESNQELLGKHSSVINEISPKELSRISLLKSPNQVFLTLRHKSFQFDYSEINKGLSFYMDDIRDPGNLGTIFRIADWFGVRWVFLSPDCVEVFNPKVIQSSMGAFLRVKSATISIDDLVKKVPGIPVLGTTLDGHSIFEAKTKLPAIVVVGNESRGIAENIEKFLTQKISIPRHPNGGAESLNAAVATGIICAHLVNQKSKI